MTKQNDDGITSVRKLPEQSERVETGVIRFGDDWPGVFIRGDNAFGYAIYLQAILEEYEGNDMIAQAVVQGLLQVLQSSNINK